jgi:hypothetical protein
MSKYSISLGMLSDSINTQLEEYGICIDAAKIRHWENVRHSINMLYMNDYISENQVRVLRNKLGVKINKHIKLLKQSICGVTNDN